MSDTVQYYLDEKLASEPDYGLAVAFVPPDRRYAFRLLLACHAEARGLLFGPAEAEVTLARLGWWHEEWERMIAGQPRHPLTRSLHDCGRFEADDLNPLLVAVGRLLQLESCPSSDALLAGTDAMGESLGRLDAALFGGELKRTAPIWQDVFACERVLDLPGLLAHGRAVLPMDLSASLQLGRQAVIDEPEARQRLQAELAGAVPDAAAAPDRLGYAWIFRGIRRRRLAALSGRRAAAGALSRLWAAWQASRERAAVTNGR